MNRLTAILGLALVVALIRAAWTAGGFISSFYLGHPWTGYAADMLGAVGVAGLAAVAFSLARREAHRG